jgi:hypothetical protein
MFQFWWISQWENAKNNFQQIQDYEYIYINIYIYHQYNDQHISFKLFFSNRFIIISPVLSKILVELAPKFQASQILWQRHLCETLNEAITESQALQSAWQGHSF